MPVRLGNSGLKVSKIILGCMSYGSKEWQQWVLEEDEAIKHIKFAYVYLAYEKDHRRLSFTAATTTASPLSTQLM